MAKISDVLPAFEADQALIDKYYNDDKLSVFLGDDKEYANVPCSIIFYYDPSVNPNSMLIKSNLVTDDGTVLFSNRAAAQSFYAACAFMTQLIEEADSDEVRNLITNFRNPFINQCVELLKVARPQYNPGASTSGKPVSARVSEDMAKPAASNRVTIQQEELTLNPETNQGLAEGLAEEEESLHNEDDTELGDDAYDGESSF